MINDHVYIQVRDHNIYTLMIIYLLLQGMCVNNYSVRTIKVKYKDKNCQDLSHVITLT